jgi:hypothetical protein
MAVNIPGNGDVEDVGGFNDLRRLGDRASLQRAVEVALMSDPPLAILITPAQRTSLPSLSGQQVSTYTTGEGEEMTVTAVTATMTGETDENDHEFITLSGHGGVSSILLLQADLD